MHILLVIEPCLCHHPFVLFRYNRSTEIFSPTETFRRPLPEIMIVYTNIASKNGISLTAFVSCVLSFLCRGLAFASVLGLALAPETTNSNAVEGFVGLHFPPTVHSHNCLRKHHLFPLPNCFDLHHESRNIIAWMYLIAFPQRQYNLHHVMQHFVLRLQR